jgi:hypothetical protein
MDAVWFLCIFAAIDEDQLHSHLCDGGEGLNDERLELATACEIFTNLFDWFWCEALYESMLRNDSDCFHCFGRHSIRACLVLCAIGAEEYRVSNAMMSPQHTRPRGECAGSAYVAGKSWTSLPGSPSRD